MDDTSADRPPCWEYSPGEARRQGASREDCISLEDVLQARLDPERVRKERPWIRGWRHQPYAAAVPDRIARP